ncbi:glycoside hydrolase family 2 protein [Lacticaseibacillus sp. GG6-2]
MVREEYPRPQFERHGNWQSLNGDWAFAFDDAQSGVAAGWPKQLPAARTITVPFVYQATASGIGETAVHDTVWYQRTVSLSQLAESQRAWLHFGAVDYFADIYVNGQFVGHHEGGDASFGFDITQALVAGDKQVITVRAQDRTYDETLPRGKQSWTGKSEGIWYTNSTGIWQPVWLEVVDVMRLIDVQMTPDLDATAVDLGFDLSDAAVGESLQYEISFGDTLVAEDRLRITANHVQRRVELLQRHIFRTAFHSDGWTWTPEHPNLFDITIRVLADTEVRDEVQSYFGLRKVSTEDGMIMLNNKPYYQRLVLDQGYWPEGLLTAPSDDAFKRDIALAKQMGFNGCRKHQKIEDPRFLYWADHLGYLVWEEIASVPYYTSTAATRVVDAWQAAVKRDYNHPSIIMWVPLNESWGVDQIHHNAKQQHFATSLYHLLHALDDTRLVQSNDGWDVTVGDVVAIHNYSHGTSATDPLYARYQETLATADKLVSQAPGNWAIFAQGYHYAGQPLVLSEYGGISYAAERADGWGYTTASSQDEFLAELQRLNQAIAHSQALWGYCYTQLTDVEQEENGLLTTARKPKAPLAALHDCFAFPVSGRLQRRPQGKED